MLPESYTNFYASQVNPAAWLALEATAVMRLPHAAREQAKLPRALGGLSVHDPAQLADLARVAALLQLWPQVHQRPGADRAPGGADD